MNTYKRYTVQQEETPAEDVMIVSEQCMNPW